MKLINALIHHRLDLGLLFLLTCLVTLVSGCQSSPPISPSAPPQSRSMSIQKIQKAIHFKLAADNLGFVEKRYNPCKIGAKPLTPNSCRQEYLTLIGIQLKCRNSRGTVQRVVKRIEFPDPNIKWKIAGYQGLIRLNRDGLGVIRVRSSWSLKNQRVKIQNRGQFLYMRVSEIRSVVTPIDWCI